MKANKVKMEFLIDELTLENWEIYKHRPDLEFFNDFSEDGLKVHENELMIFKLSSSVVAIRRGECTCTNYRIKRQRLGYAFCAWCHKLILNDNVVFKWDLFPPIFNDNRCR